jgi:hypothetical protein
MDKETRIAELKKKLALVQQENKKKDEEREKERKLKVGFSHYINGLDAIGEPIENITYDWYIKNVINKKTETKKRGRPKKERTEGEIMKASSKMEKKNDGYYIDTELKVRKGLSKGEKKTLRKSVIDELDEEIKGSGLRRKKNIILEFSDSDSDSSSDDEYITRKGYTIRGKIKKGRGRPQILKTYGSLLDHLVSHIKDPKEKVDPRDYNQSIKLIKEIEGVKRGRGRPRKLD